MALAQPALEYLVSLSGDSLDAFHFSRLATAANLQNEMSEVLKQWIEAILEAKLARWVHGRRNDCELTLSVRSLGSGASDARREASTIAASYLFVLKTLDPSALVVATSRTVWIKLSSAISFAATHALRRFARPVPRDRSVLSKRSKHPFFRCRISLSFPTRRSPSSLIFMRKTGAQRS